MKTYRISLTGLAVALWSAMAVNAAAPKVICVPWQAQNPAVAHDAVSGVSTTLKGAARDAVGGVALVTGGTYRWEFGDGSAPETGTITDPYAIEVAHTYTGAIGTRFVARLTVTATNSESGSDTYLVQIQDGATLTTKVNMAIDKGLWNLHKQLVRSTDSNGQPSGYWSGTYRVGYAAACLDAFQINGHQVSGNADEDPYVETVLRALNYLFSQIHTVTIAAQPAGSPDSNGNGYGFDCTAYSSDQMYETGIALLAIASCGAPDRVVLTGNANVLGKKVREIGQEIVDFIAFAQQDTSSTRGGWRYTANGGADHSAVQWVVLGMETAETNLRVTVPAFVRSELQVWCTYIQDASGGCGYTSPGYWVNMAKSGGNLSILRFLGKDSTDTKCADTLRYVSNNWNSTNNEYGTSGPGNRAYYYYTMYSTMKGLRLQNVTTFPTGTNAGVDWYADPAVGYAPHIVGLQRDDGSWPQGYWFDGPMTTAFAILTLLPTVTVPGPVANAGPDVATHPPTIPVKFDASASYHNDPNRKIVQYQWDFDASNGVNWSHPDFQSTTPLAQHTYPLIMEGGDIKATDYTVTLRVVDNNSPVLTGEDTLVVHIGPPHWPPVAVLKSADAAAQGKAIKLDGSTSFDPNGQYFPLGNPMWGQITKYEWDLDGDGAFDDAVGATVNWSSPELGQHVVGLKVTNTFNLTDSVTKVINVTESQLPDLLVQKIDVRPSTRRLYLLGSMDVYWQVKNAGLANASGCKIGFWLSADAQFNTGDVFLGERTVAPLAADGATKLKRESLKVPVRFNPSANWNIVAVVDYRSQVDEKNETNNQASAPWSVH